jgi:hypothetical protein
MPGIFIRFRSNTSKLASFFRATESVAGIFNTSGLAPRIFILPQQGAQQEVMSLPESFLFILYLSSCQASRFARNSLPGPDERERERGKKKEGVTPL